MKILGVKSEVLDNAPAGFIDNLAETLPMVTDFSILINKGKQLLTVDIASRVPYMSGGAHLFTVSIKIHYHHTTSELSLADFSTMMNLAVAERNALISIRNGQDNPPLHMLPLTEAETQQLFTQQLAYEQQ